MALFPPRPAPFVNYDWVDTVSGIGYLIYDAFATRPSGAAEYYLLPALDMSEVFSAVETGGNLYSTSAGNTSSTYTKIIDLDFDAPPLQYPRTIKGTAIVRVPVYLLEDEDGETHYQYIIVKLRKSDDTEIASVQSITSAVTAHRELAITLAMTVPLTHFKKGEKIRLTIELWQKNSAGVKDATGTIGHNPTDSATDNFTAGNSRLTLAVPFRMDI